MHLSQPIGAGAFDGQHGMSLAISSIVSAADISSVMICIDVSGDICAMTGRETGANARPATTRIASSRNLVAIARRPAFHIMDSVRPELIGINPR